MSTYFLRGKLEKLVLSDTEDGIYYIPTNTKTGKEKYMGINGLILLASEQEIETASDGKVTNNIELEISVKVTKHPDTV